MNSVRPSRLWLAVHTLAIGFSLMHLTLDWHLDLFGPARDWLTLSQTLTLVIGSTLYALWAMSLTMAGQGSRRAMIATIVTGALGGLGNGFTIVYCPPICGAAFPWGDLSHVGSLIFGAWAVIESVRALKTGAKPAK
jgi:hypothetical protein